MSDIKAKTAEFARLFEHFEHLASQGTRNCDDVSSSAPANGGTHDDSPSLQISADLESVLQRLETLLSTRAQKVSIQQHKVGGRPSKNAMAFSGLPRNKLESVFQEVTKFPLGEQYPFTFKLMIHKLYDLAEWAAMVKEVVEKSQMQFKPLAEWELKRTEDKDTIGSTKANLVAGGRKGNLQQTRPRSHSMVGTSKTDSRMSLTTKIQIPKPTDRKLRGDVRALKKRCLERRKSMSGLITGNPGATGGDWTYDAAVSSIECNGHGHQRNIGQNNTRDHSLQWRQSSAHLKRCEKVALQTGVKLESNEPIIWQWDMPPLQLLRHNRDISAKRRAKSLADIISGSPNNEVVPTKMKRPLSPP